MKKVTRTLALLLTLCTLLSCMSIFVSADSMISTENMDVTASTASALKNIQTDNTLSDSDKIQQIITLLFDAKREQLVNSSLADFDFSIFGEVNEVSGADMLCFERSVQAQKGIHAAADYSLVNSATDLTFDSIEIDNDSATVNVYELFSYYYYTAEGIADIESSVGIDYEILLQKNASGWTITGIDFCNDVTEPLRDTSIDVSSYVQNHVEAANTVTESTLISTYGIAPALETAASTTYTTLDTTLFARYALTYGGSKRNPNFMDFTDMGGDCQNFASQCMWAGLGGETSSLSSAGAPMINPTMAGSTGRGWYVFPGGTHSASWTSCSNFKNYISAGSYSTLGLYGTVYSGIANARIGDIVHILDSNGSSYHAYVVVQVDGVEGSRTASQVIISAHTRDTVYEKLSSAAPDGQFITIRVHGVRTA